MAERVEAALRAEPGVEDVQTHLEPLEQPVAARADDDTAEADEQQRRRIAELALARTGGCRRASCGCCTPPAASSSSSRSVVPADMTLPDAHESASRLEDEIRAGQPHMQDVVVHTEP